MELITYKGLVLHTVCNNYMLQNTLEVDFACTIRIIIVGIYDIRSQTRRQGLIIQARLYSLHRESNITIITEFYEKLALIIIT